MVVSTITQALLHPTIRHTDASGRGESIQTIVVLEDAQRVITGGGGTLQTWSLATGARLEWVGDSRSSAPVYGFVMQENGSQALVKRGFRHTIERWSMDNQALPSVAIEAGGVLDYRAFSPDGRYLILSGSHRLDLLAGVPLLGGPDPKLYAVQTSDGKTYRVFSGHTGFVTAVAISADSAWMASAGLDGTVNLWRLNG